MFVGQIRRRCRPAVTAGKMKTVMSRGGTGYVDTCDHGLFRRLHTNSEYYDDSATVLRELSDESIPTNPKTAHKDSAAFVARLFHAFSRRTGELTRSQEVKGTTRKGGIL